MRCLKMKSREKMNLSEQQKAKAGHLAIQEIASQFGTNDLVKQAWFDVLLEVIYGASETGDNIHLLGTPRQADNKNVDQSGNGDMPSYKID